MSHPYVPLGTPVTVTVDGFWDGDHNGNEPYLSYRGHDGQTRKMHIPHGALVQTKPEEVEALEFTVDKTPKPAPTYPDFTKPRLRTWQASNGFLWFEVNPDEWVIARDWETAARRYSPYTWHSTAWLESYRGPLTDVTDTGEPLVHNHGAEEGPGLSCPEREVDGQLVGACMDDTPPQSGDRVRLTIEGTYQDAGGGEFNVTRDDGRTNWFTDSSGAEIRVIARAKPPVPEDPQCDVERVVAAGGLERWEYDQYTDSYGNGADHWRWEKLWAVAQGNGDKLYPLVTTRGPEIVG